MNLVGYALDEAMRAAGRNLRRMHILGSSLFDNFTAKDD